MPHKVHLNLIIYLDFIPLWYYSFPNVLSQKPECNQLLELPSKYCFLLMKINSWLVVDTNGAWKTDLILSDKSHRQFSLQNDQTISVRIQKARSFCNKKFMFKYQMKTFKLDVVGLFQKEFQWELILHLTFSSLSGGKQSWLLICFQNYFLLVCLFVWATLKVGFDCYIRRAIIIT